jgi:hypothetical protein
MTCTRLKIIIYHVNVHTKPLKIPSTFISRNMSIEYQNDKFVLFLSIFEIHMEHMPIADQFTLHLNSIQ